MDRESGTDAPRISGRPNRFTNLGTGGARTNRRQVDAMQRDREATLVVWIRWTLTVLAVLIGLLTSLGIVVSFCLWLYYRRSVPL